MSDVIYTAVDGKQYKAVPPVTYRECTGCAFENEPWNLNCGPTHSQGKDCSNIIWQPIAIQKPTDNFHQWLQENAEMFRPIFERMEGKK